MKKYLKQTLDFFIGINFSFGFCAAIWLVWSLFSETAPAWESKNVLFLLFSIIIPWLFNFIFGYSSYVYAKGILHGVLWFVMDIILYTTMYGIALDAIVLLKLGGLFILLYGLGLWACYTASCKLNMPVRCVTAFLKKVTDKIEK